MLQDKQDTLNSIGLLVLRLAVGGMMLTHGWPKLLKLFSAPGKFADPFGLGPEISLALTVFAEVVCALLILFGGWIRLAAVPLLFTMIVAAFIIHGGDPFKKKELALMYGSGTLVLLLMGAGKYSVDAFLKARKEEKEGS